MIDPVTAALAGFDAQAPVERAGVAAALRRTAGAGLPVAPALRLAVDLAGHPLAAAGRGTGLAVELLGIGLRPGGSARARLARARQATHAAAAGLVDRADLGPADRERLRAAIDAVAELADTVLPERAAPVPPPGVRLTAGEELAATAGAVVLRTPVFELIRYLPRTEAVRAVPLLVVPPLAGRHYLADLAPGASLVEDLVGRGQQVLALSWRNPGPADDGRGLDACAASVLDAMDAVERLTRSPATALLAIGSAATVATALVGHLTAAGAAERVAGLTLAVSTPGPPRAPDAATGAALLAWAADPVRVPARLRAELTDLAERDAMARPGAVRVLGTPIDLGKIDREVYLAAGDLGRWRDTYRTAGLLGGDCRFALTGGPPVSSFLAAAGGSFLAGPATDPDPDRWAATAPLTTGLWWADHAGWLAARTGPDVDAPPELGGRGLHPLAPSPGDYVHSR
jgi:poly[(R)-3-hydroxyalkanoate] polymerase subunit PhaC